MAKQVYEYSRVAAQNNFLFSDGGMPEGMDRQQLNDSGRERMRALRELYDTKTDSGVGLEFLDLMRNPTDATAFTVTRLSATEIRIASGATNMSAYFNTNRRIQTYTGATVTDQLFVASVVYSNPNTDVTIFSADGSTVTAGIDGVKLHVSPTIGRLAFTDAVTFPFVIPAGLTNADFDAALAAIDSAGGGILMLLGGTHLLTGVKTLDFPIHIWGRGTDHSVIKADDATDLAQMFNITGVNASNIKFSDFTYNGNRANQTGGTGDGFLITQRATEIVFDNVKIVGTRRNGIHLNNNAALSDVHTVKFSNLIFEDIGGDGIGSEDSQSAMYGIQASRISIDAPGQEQTESAGIRVAGQWNLSGINVTGLDLGGGNTQRGIWFLERLAIDPNPQDAHLCTLSGFSISGTGGNSRGIECHGEGNSIGRGAISLSGVVSRGVLIGGTLGSQTPQDSSLDDIYIEDCNIGVFVESTASKISIGSTVRTKDCATGMDIQGDSCEVRGARMQGGTTGLKLAATSSECIVEDALIDGQSGNGVEVAAGAVDSLIRGNTFRDIAGKGILDAGTGTVWWGKWNHFDNVSGFNIDANSGDEYIGTGPTRIVTLGANQTNYGSAEIAVTGMEGISFPIPPDGARAFRVTARVRHNTDTVVEAQTVRLRMGTGPTHLSDAVVDSEGYSFASTGFNQLHPHGTTHIQDTAGTLTQQGEIVVVPAAGEQLTLSVDSDRTTSDVIAHGSAANQTYLAIEYLDG